MATAAPADRQSLLDRLARAQFIYSDAQQGGGDKGTAGATYRLAQKALADYDAKAKAPAVVAKPAAAVAAAAAPVAITPLPTLTNSPPPLPAAPVAVTNPEAQVAAVTASAQDRANIVLQQPIQAPTAAEPGQAAAVEDEAAKARRKLAERNFLGRITGVLTGVGGAKTASSQVGSRSLLGGTA